MIVITHKGNFKKTETFLKRTLGLDYSHILEKYGREGVIALSSATPVDSGETAKSWSYEIRILPSRAIIYWRNSHVIDGVPIAILIQYGHGTRNRGYIQGRDYINPAIQPIFDKITNDLWKEVTNNE